MPSLLRNFRHQLCGVARVIKAKLSIEDNARSVCQMLFSCNDFYDPVTTTDPVTMTVQFIKLPK